MWLCVGIDKKEVWLTIVKIIMRYVPKQRLINTSLSYTLLYRLHTSQNEHLGKLRLTIDCLTNTISTDWNIKTTTPPPPSPALRNLGPGCFRSSLCSSPSARNVATGPWGCSGCGRQWLLALPLAG